MGGPFWETFWELWGPVAAAIAVIGSALAVGIWTGKIIADRRTMDEEMVRFRDELDRFQTDSKQSIRDSKNEITQDMRDFKKECKEDIRDIDKAFKDELEKMRRRLPSPPTG